jgi:nickel superoxide dismutase
MNKKFKKIKAEAHCDIPCGIYEPIAAKIAAKTVLRMLLQIQSIPMPKDWANKDEVLVYLNEITRRIQTKEEHAEICKRELRILWADFFKKEHLEKYPNLHDIFWEALKLASKAKQNIDPKIAEELCKKVDEIAKIFYEVKNDPERFKSYLDLTEKLF